MYFTVQITAACMHRHNISICQPITYFRWFQHAMENSNSMTLIKTDRTRAYV